MPTPASIPADPVLRAAGLLAPALGALVVLLPAQPLGVDLPTHAAMGALLASPGAAAGLIDTSWTPTTQLFVRLVQLFATFASPETAARIAQLVVLGVSWFGARRLARRVGASLELAGAFAVAAQLGFCFAMGFSNFLLALALVPHALAAWLDAARSGTPRAATGAALALVLVAHAHAVVALLTLCQVAAFTVASPVALARRGAPRWIGAALVAAPAALFSGWVLAAVRSQENAARAGADTLRVAWNETLAQAGATSFGGVSNTGSLPLFVLLAALTAALLPRRTAADRGLPPARASVALALVPWLVAWAVTPFHLPGWAYAQPRLLAFFATVAPALVFAGAPLPGAAARRWAARGAAALVLAHLAVTAWAARDEGARIAEVVETLRAARDGRAAIDPPAPGRILTLRLAAGERDDRPWITPWLHADAWIAAEGGALAGWAPFNRWMHSVRLRPDAAPWAQSPATYLYRSLDDVPPGSRDGMMRALVDRAAWQAVAFDTILAPGCDDAVRERMALRGHPIWRPCRWSTRSTALSVALRAPDLAGPAQLLLVWPETLGPIAGAQLPLPFDGVVPLGALPAGPATLRLQRPSGEVLSEAPVVVAGPEQRIELDLSQPPAPQPTTPRPTTPPPPTPQPPAPQPITP